MEFSEFFRVRRDFCGFPTWITLSEVSGVGVASIYRIVRDGPIRTTVAIDLRDKIAKVLHFENWLSMVRAWKADDVLEGLAMYGFMQEDEGEIFTESVPGPPIEVPAEAYRKKTKSESAPSPGTSPDVKSPSPPDYQWLVEFLKREHAEQDQLLSHFSRPEVRKISAACARILSKPKHPAPEVPPKTKEGKKHGEQAG